MSSPWLAPLRPIGRFGETLLDRVLCVAGAVGLSQAPEFYQQYLQRLGGHLDEAMRQLAKFEAVARESGVTLAELITKTRAASEPVGKLGDVMAESVERVTQLRAAEEALRGATLWERPWVFIQKMDTEIAAATWEVFKPAVPVTAEGFVYAGCGMVLALVLYQAAVAWPLRVAAAKWRTRGARGGLTRAGSGGTDRK